MESNMNEGEIITLASSFKDIVEKKNEEIIELQKVLMMCYTLFRLLDDEIENHDLVERGRCLCSDMISELIIKND